MDLNDEIYNENMSPREKIDNKIENLKAKKDKMVEFLIKLSQQYKKDQNKEEMVIAIEHQIKCLEKRFQLQYDELENLRNKYRDDDDLQKDLQKDKDELEHLTEIFDELEKSLNDLTNDLKSLLDEQNKKKELLKTLLDSLPLRDDFLNLLDDCLPGDLDLELEEKWKTDSKTDWKTDSKTDWKTKHIIEHGKEKEKTHIKKEEESFSSSQEEETERESLSGTEEDQIAKESFPGGKKDHQKGSFSSEEEEETDTDIESLSSSEDEREDTTCIQELGQLLKHVLAEVNMVRPSDPIHYIEKWLRSYVENTNKIKKELDDDNELKEARKYGIRNDMNNI